MKADKQYPFVISSLTEEDNIEALNDIRLAIQPSMHADYKAFKQSRGFSDGVKLASDIFDILRTGDPSLYVATDGPGIIALGDRYISVTSQLGVLECPNAVALIHYFTGLKLTRPLLNNIGKGLFFGIFRPDKKTVNRLAKKNQFLVYDQTTSTGVFRVEIVLPIIVLGKKVDPKGIFEAVKETGIGSKDIRRFPLRDCHGSSLLGDRIIYKHSPLDGWAKSTLVRQGETISEGLPLMYAVDGDLCVNVGAMNYRDASIILEVFELTGVNLLPDLLKRRALSEYCLDGYLTEIETFKRNKGREEVASDGSFLEPGTPTLFLIATRGTDRSGDLVRITLSPNVAFQNTIVAIYQNGVCYMESLCVFYSLVAFGADIFPSVRSVEAVKVLMGDRLR